MGAQEMKEKLALLAATLESTRLTIDIVFGSKFEGLESLSSDEVAALRSVLEQIDCRVDSIKKRLPQTSGTPQPKKDCDENLCDTLPTNCIKETHDSSPNAGSFHCDVALKNQDEDAPSFSPAINEEASKRGPLHAENDSVHSGRDPFFDARQSNESASQIRQRGLSILPRQPDTLEKSLFSNSIINCKRSGAIHPMPHCHSGSLEQRQRRIFLSQASIRSAHERALSIQEPWIKSAVEAFNIIDVNNDGFLQKEEVLSAVQEMQKEGGTNFGIDSLETAEEMMNDVDLDGDGQIDINEFIDMMKGASGKAGKVPDKKLHRMSQLARNVLLAHQRKLESSAIGNDHWMIHPHGALHESWDILISLLILITVAVVPLSLGWEELNEDLFEMNLTIDIIFLLDVCKTFCTGFIDDNDAVIMDAKVVRWNYLTGYFLSDFCSSFPLDLVLRAAGLSSDPGTVSGTKHSLKMLKLLRVFKIFRLLRINRMLRYVKVVFLWLEETMHIRISDGFTKLLRLGVGALVLGHWIGCFNFMLVRLHEFPEDSWVVYAGLHDKNPYDQWTWSFFKALAQMIMIGFETPPFTNASCDTASHWCGIEHWVTLGFVYLGALFYSLLISSISTILQAANLSTRKFEEELMQIDDYMRSKRLPAALREKVKDYFYLQHPNRKLFDEGQLLQMVSPILRREIQQFNCRGISAKVPVLSSVSNKAFCEELATIMVPTIAFSEEVIIRENTTGQEMYFIQSGVVEIFVNTIQKSTYVAIGDGCYFGEVSLLLGVRRTASARTKTQCMLYMIPRDKLMMILDDYPEAGATMRKVASSRKKRLAHYIDPKANPLFPEDEVDAEDSKTELFGVDADKLVSEKDEAFESHMHSARMRHTYRTKTAGSAITGTKFK